MLYRETLRQLLCSEGYEVDLVPDGLAGLEMLRHSRPSAVIVDYSILDPRDLICAGRIVGLDSRSASGRSQCEFGGRGEGPAA